MGFLNMKSSISLNLAEFQSTGEKIRFITNQIQLKFFK